MIEPIHHRRLLDAQDTRNIGDYGVGVDISPEQTFELLEWASQFLDTAIKWLKQQP